MKQINQTLALMFFGVLCAMPSAIHAKPVGQPNEPVYSNQNASVEPCSRDPRTGQYVECPETCKRIKIVCQEPSCPQQSGMYVRAYGDGNCDFFMNKQHFVTNLIQSPEWSAQNGFNQTNPLFNLFKCGATLTPNHILQIVDEFRNLTPQLTQVTIELFKKLIEDGAMTSADATVGSIELLDDLCVLKDELLHMTDRYFCCSHKSCAEESSGDSYLACLKDPLKTKKALDLILSAYPSSRDTVQQMFCGSQLNVATALNVEKCICANTRKQPPGLTKQNCEDCVDRFCDALAPEVKNALTPTCRAILANDPSTAKTIAEKCRNDYRNATTDSHSCAAYLEKPASKTATYSPYQSTPGQTASCYAARSVRPLTSVDKTLLELPNRQDSGSTGR
jgi:hypothetical protein